jgi:hypothetical protein
MPTTTATFEHQARIGTRPDSPLITVKLTPAGQFTVHQSGHAFGKPWAAELTARSVDGVRTALRERLPDGMETMRVEIEDDVYGLNHAGVADIVAEAYIAMLAERA